MTQELYKETATSVVSKLKTGEVKISELLDCLEKRIAEVEPKVHALPTTCFDRAREHASELDTISPDKRGMLAGIPITIKDLTPVEGVRTTNGSPLFKDWIPDKSDSLVTRLENQGGVVYAKSNTPEFGLGGVSFNEVFEATRTPHDLSKASGGSSGGAAASIASGTAWLSHGSDMAGSLRTPANFCGVASLRPSPHTMDNDSLFSPTSILTQQGPMGRTVDDIALFGDAMKNRPDNEFQQAASNPEKPLKVALSRDLGVATVDDQVVDQLEHFIKLLINNGCHVSEAHPDLSTAKNSFHTLRANTVAIAFENVIPDNRDLFKPEAQWNIDKGLALTSGDIREATRQQGMLMHSANQFMQDYDVLICPASSKVSVDWDRRYPDDDTVPYSDYLEWLSIAYAITATALPVLTIPVAKIGNMPMAVQLVGKAGGDADLFSFAKWIEKLVGWDPAPVL